MNCLEQNGKEVVFPKDVHIIVLIDSLYQKKTVLPHHSLLLWQEEFDAIKVPVFIVSPDMSYRVNESVYHYIYNPDLSVFKQYRAIVKKSVFGHEKEVIQLTILLMNGDQIVKRYCRSNQKTIVDLYIKALHLRCRMLERNIKKKLTKKTHFDTI